jgi:hypothetical protein
MAATMLPATGNGKWKPELFSIAGEGGRVGASGRLTPVNGASFCRNLELLFIINAL